MKAVLIFCEGAHDASLLVRLLPRLPGVKQSKKRLDQYPAPFADFWRLQLAGVIGRVGTRPAEHRGKLAPPWLEVSFESNDVVYMIFSMSGKDQRPAIGELLKKWKKLMAPDENPFTSPGVTFDVWAAAFIVDADDAGVDTRREEIFEWLRGEGLIDARPENGAWARTDSYAVGGFVVHGPDSENGSIEDHWVLIAEAIVGDRMRDARGFVQAHQYGECKTAKPGYANKALLTIAGQLEHPGESLAMILRDTRWAKDDELEISPIGKELLDFFQATPV